VFFLTVGESIVGFYKHMCFGSAEFSSGLSRPVTARREVTPETEVQTDDRNILFNVLNLLATLESLR